MIIEIFTAIGETNVNINDNHFFRGQKLFGIIVEVDSLEKFQFHKKCNEILCLKTMYSNSCH